MEGARKLERSGQLSDGDLSGVLSRVLGMELISVEYWALQHEISDENEIEDDDFYFGGEVRLIFSGSVSIYLTWHESVDSPDDFYISASEHLSFRQNTLVKWPVSGSMAWRESIRKNFTGFSIFSKSKIPQVVELEFENSRIIVGIGNKAEFGDGDDILVMISENFSARPTFNVLEEHNL